MNEVPLISVVLCTYNNANSLAITLRQLSQCRVNNPCDFEILVIDNNSLDHTRAITDAVAATSTLSIRYVFEARQGLSNARNLGLIEVKGDYILFTDDDADIPIDWLEQYQCEIQRSNADCLYSKIEIRWDQDKPWWFDHRYNPFFVLLDYGDKRLLINDIHHEFFGKNFCCKTSLLKNMGGFDERLGRNGALLAAGEETIIYRKLVGAGKKLIYFPGASVGHRLKPEEFTTENIEKKFTDGAVSSFHIAEKFAIRRIMNRPIQPLTSSIKCCFQAVLGKSIAKIKKDNREAFYWSLNMKRSMKILKLWIAG